MQKTSLCKAPTIYIITAIIAIGAALVFAGEDHIWYWIFGVAFGCTLQASGVCFVTASSEPFTTGSTTQIRAILIGILVASLGISVIKFMSGGLLDYMSVSPVSIPLILGAFIFGTGMTLAGCCSSGAFIRIAEGYTIHIVTLVCILAGYFLANTHYAAVWAPMIADAPAVFLPYIFGWIPGIMIHIALFLCFYLIALKWDASASRDASSSLLAGGIVIGILSILHFIILDSGWSVSGAFFWTVSLASGDGITDFSANIRNIGLLFGSLTAALALSKFKLRKINSAKQVMKSAAGGLLMGYGAGIASGCNVSAFFTAAASLSLSAWVFMLFLIAGAFVGTKLLYRIV